MSTFVKKSLVSDYDISEKKVRVVGAGPVLHDLPSIDDLHDDGRTILFVGLNFKGKGGQILLSAMERVKQVVPHSRLLVVGVKRRSDNDVHYLGKIPSNQIGSFYQNATVFTLPTFREAFGLVFLEAMAYGLPCIGTNIEAIPEIIVNSKTGYIIPPGNDEILAERLIELLNNPELRRQMGRAGRERLEQHFTWLKVVEVIENILEKDNL